MTVGEITSTDDLVALAGEWSCLWDRCPSATPFQSSDWLLPWWKHLGGRGLWTLTLRDGGRLVGLAPLFLYEPTRQLTLLGNGISDYVDVLIEPGCADHVMEAFFDYLVAHRERWDACDFQDLRGDSPLCAAAPRPGLFSRLEPASVCPVVALPETTEEFRAGLGRDLRRNLRRYRTRLEAGGLEFQTAALENVSESVQAFFDLHAARWSARGSSGVLADKAVQAFHLEAAQRLAVRGWLRLHTLGRRDAPGAVAYTMQSRGRSYAYLGGFDPALAHCSPGALLIAFAIEDAIRAGMREFDFLRGREPYKYQWGARDCETYRWIARHASSGSGPRTPERRILNAARPPG